MLASAVGAVSAYCDRHSMADDVVAVDLLRKYDEAIEVAERTPLTCAAPSCSEPVSPGS